MKRFWRIPPLMVDEVCAHMKEILEVGAIHPRQIHGIMLLCWSTRKMEVCAFALTSIS